MPYSIRRIDRPFTPAEAEKVTGASVALQRDWRRRGLLPKNETGKWTTFDLDDIVKLSVMKAFSDAGFSVQFVVDFAGLAILPTFAAIDNIPGAVEFSGAKLPEKIKRLMLARGSTVGATGRYLVMAMIANRVQPNMRRTNTLEEIDKFLSDCNATNCALLDCDRLAWQIAERTGLPLICYEITETREKK